VPTGVQENGVPKLGGRLLQRYIVLLLRKRMMGVLLFYETLPNVYVCNLL
jgi:hypothetical protein